MKFVKDPMSALTHFLGILLAIPAAIVLIQYAINNGSILHIVGFSIFGITMIMLYTASTIYHVIKQPKISHFLRKVDHMMIFIFIAGTYTPICLVALKGTIGYILLVVIWSIAVGGILLKIFWMNAPRWLYTGIYVAMGWTIIIAIYPLIKVMPSGAMVWLVLGGVIYTLGGLIYGTKWPKINNKVFGFHEIFHLFILGGTICHFIMMYNYISILNIGG